MNNSIAVRKTHTKIYKSNQTELTEIVLKITG